MSAPIPTLGYRSRTDAALAFVAQGMPRAQIAAQMGIARWEVDALLHQAKRRKYPAPVPDRRGGRRHTHLPMGTLDGLRPHASKRGVSPAELARRLLAAAVAGNLIDAILDDRSKP